MKDYMAPMEGVTNFIYRNVYHEFYYPMDKYFTPFISAKPYKRLSRKEIYSIAIMPIQYHCLKVTKQKRAS